MLTCVMFIVGNYKEDNNLMTIVVLGMAGN
jgi:hypothetical protein